MTASKDPPFLGDRVKPDDAKAATENKQTAETVETIRRAINEAQQKVGWARHGQLNPDTDAYPERADFYADRAASAEQAADMMSLWLAAAESRRAQSEKASKPRGKRDEPLWRRGLRCALNENANITADELRDWLDGQARTYDDDDIELKLDEKRRVVVVDLATAETAVIEHLREYLRRARNT